MMIVAMADIVMTAGAAEIAEAVAAEVTDAPAAVVVTEEAVAEAAGINAPPGSERKFIIKTSSSR